MNAKEFTYHMNAKEMMMFDMARKYEKQVEALEKETGVNLDHYHKLLEINIEIKRSRKNIYFNCY